ncbi:MAG: Hsp70 family protein [Ardenticatenaceae bacterium]|nr:Hsp70 family protein [Ardenticatenaceae bacterium]MCB9444214.1 Hsp70 family protein [Ardenticatenaceae bacterium]
MIVGMDFGTTNSGMAVYDGSRVQVLPLDPDNPNPRVLRTAVYVTTDQAIHIGRTAVDLYFTQNIGRPVKMRKIWVGELEIRGGDMYYVTDAYAYVDVLSPGRLFLSVKTSLRDENYPGTVVGQNYYSLENLIALYLTVVKTRAERLLGRELKQVVLGRPVHFAADLEHDRLAQSRLLQAAFRAGYERVYLQPEPIAAAYSYETTLDKPQNVLVFDFGGGTLDLTVMRLGDPGRRQVLATGGIPVAGDVFDQKLVRSKLPRHFGEGSFYGPRHKRLTVPQWIYDSFSNWQTLMELQAAENRQILTDIALTAQRKYQIEALLSLVSSNYGLKMFDIVEQAKRRLSEKRGAEILLEGEGFQVRDFVTRTEFERIIGAEIRAIEQHLGTVVADSGLEVGQIDAVIRTGGSSQVPAFHEMLVQKFGAEKVQAVDTFSSVTAGLGVIAHGIEAGEIEVRGFTPDDVKPTAVSSERPNVSPINLDVLQRRIYVAEKGEEAGEQGSGGAGEMALIVIGGEDLVTAVAIPQSTFQQKDPIPLADLNLDGQWTKALTADLDEQILLITTHYRFLLTTPRHLIELGQMDLKLADTQKLERGETVCSVSKWAEITAVPKLLLVTSQGVARPYPMNVLRENIEAPIPLRFDHPLPGIVITALALDEQKTLVAASRAGRALAYETSGLRLSGTQIYNCGQDDRLVSALLLDDETELALVTVDGYGRRLQSSWVPLAERPNTKGKSMIARRSEVAALLQPEAAPWLLTNERMVVGEYSRLPLEDSTKSARLLKLRAEEAVETAVG